MMLYALLLVMFNAGHGGAETVEIVVSSNPVLVRTVRLRRSAAQLIRAAP